MKYIYIYTLIFFSSLIVTADDEVIPLQNKKPRRQPQVAPIPDQRDFINDYSSKRILPNGLFIGELADYYAYEDDFLDIIRITDSFCSSLKNNINPSNIVKEYQFIFKSVYKDILSADYEIMRWFVGIPNVYFGSGEVNIELHLKERVITGTIYLEKNEQWEINDVQLELKEKRSFEPSSPYSLF